LHGQWRFELCGIAGLLFQRCAGLVGSGLGNGTPRSAAKSSSVTDVSLYKTAGWSGREIDSARNRGDSVEKPRGDFRPFDFIIIGGGTNWGQWRG